MTSQYIYFKQKLDSFFTASLRDFLMGNLRVDIKENNSNATIYIFATTT